MCKDSETLYTWYRAQYLHLTARIREIEDAAHDAGIDLGVDTGIHDSVSDTLGVLQATSSRVVLKEVPYVEQKPAKRARM